MVEVGALGLAYLAGVDGWRLAILMVVVYLPLALVPLLLLVAVKARRPVEDRAVLFCEGVASELRAGSALVPAIVSTAESVDMTIPGSPGTHVSPEELIDAVEREFSEFGLELRATIQASYRAGGAAADLFDEIGSLAIAHNEIAREVRTSSAAARATAWLFLVAPVAYLWLQTRSGGLAALLRSPEQRVVAVGGLGLFLAGLAVVVTLMWRAK